MTKLVIAGAGGHGRETLDVAEAMNDSGAGHWEFLGFIDDGQVHHDRLERRGACVVEINELDPAEIQYVIGVGDSQTRKEIDRRMGEAGFQPATLVHPTATVGSDVRLTGGVILAAGARVTTNVTLGRHTHLNVGACVSHDCEVGEYVTLSPGVLVNGECTIGDGAFFGTGAIVTPRVEVGAHAKVGAGAVVLADVPSGTTVVGIPARPA